MTASADRPHRALPLAGVRVLELGHYVAAPFCGRLLADLGADVVKVEPPTGDPVRSWGESINGNSVWWSVHGRHKRCIAVDLKHLDAVAVILRLVEASDALIENFRPGQLERMGLGESTLRAVNSALVIGRISGYGQNGPDRDKAAFGVIGEAIGGLRHLTNVPPGPRQPPPVRAGISIGDSVAGLYAALGVVVGLLARSRPGAEASTVDVALSESVLSLMEGMLPEYGALGVVRQPVGSRIPTAAPSNLYPTLDDQWIIIAANSDPIFGRLAGLIDQTLAEDDRFTNNRRRVQHVDVLDSVISTWTSRLKLDDIESLLRGADIPHTRICTASEIASDAQFRFRQMVVQVRDPLIGDVLHPGIVPRFGDSPGPIRWTGQRIGANTDSVLEEVCGFSRSEIHSLRANGVVH